MINNGDIVFPQSEPQYNFTEGPNRAERRRQNKERFRLKRWAIGVERRLMPSDKKKYTGTPSELQKAIISTLRSEPAWKKASSAKRSQMANNLARSMGWDGKKFNNEVQVA